MVRSKRTRGGFCWSVEWDAAIRKQIKECALLIPIISAATQALANKALALDACEPEARLSLAWVLRLGETKCGVAACAC